MTIQTNKTARTEADSLDVLFAELEESGDLRVIEEDETTEFKTVSTEELFDMLKARVLKGLPPHVRREIEAKETSNRA
ncbi:hypothetical protein [Breoghania sp.]|uniref:hypothetical protein n=1 Tax=Breoghania sp. TaxID=2065378 RepID=UPI002AABD3C6|nr:hypothetical protein [Breoghania sp.]